MPDLGAQDGHVEVLLLPLKRGEVVVLILVVLLTDPHY